MSSQRFEEMRLFVNTFKQSKSSLLDPEDEGPKFTRNPLNI
jgi:hypothetical protein